MGEKCAIGYCEKEATVEGPVKISRSLSPVDMVLCAEHAGLFIVGEIEGAEEAGR